MTVAKPPVSPPLLWNAVATVLLVVLALVTVCDGLLMKRFRFGPESILVTFLLWPIAIVCGAILAAITKRTPVLAVFVLLLGLGEPFVAIAMRDSLNSLDEWKAQRHRIQLALRAPGELEFLRDYMSTPRTVISASFPFVVVEGGYGLVLFDVQGPSGYRTLIDPFLQNVVVGRRVTAVFPADFLARYSSGARSAVTVSYARGPSQNFGDAPAVIMLDSMNVNAELRCRYGYLSHADSVLMMNTVPAESAWTISSGRDRWKWVPGQGKPIWEPH